MWRREKSRGNESGLQRGRMDDFLLMKPSDLF